MHNLLYSPQIQHLTLSITPCTLNFPDSRTDLGIVLETM
jgi:hypothetical protein